MQVNFPRQTSGKRGARFVYPRIMHFPSVLFAGCVAASLCLSSSAQATDQASGSQQQQAPAPTPAPTQAPAAQGSTPPLKLENLPRDPHTPTPEEEAAAEAARQR